MAEELVEQIIERQDWLDPLADQVQKAVTDGYAAAGEAGQQAKDFLHGTWLGHPLHAAITDVPLGAWTATLVMDAVEDITGRTELRAGADLALTVGLAGAVASAAAGITDWSATDGRARKIGLTHGLMNVAGTLLYGASLAARTRGSRSTGRGLALLGYAMSMGAAYLGGKLAYREQIGADHTLGQQFPKEFTPALAADELGEDEMKRATPQGARVLVARDKGTVCAIGEVCSHLGGPLAEGKYENGCVTCPWHGSRFSVRDGKVIHGPAVHPQPHLETRIQEGQIEVRKTEE